LGIIFMLGTDREGVGENIFSTTGDFIFLLS
jgi:hypothetical protein